MKFTYYFPKICSHSISVRPQTVDVVEADVEYLFNKDGIIINFLFKLSGNLVKCHVFPKHLATTHVNTRKSDHKMDINKTNNEGRKMISYLLSLRLKSSASMSVRLMPTMANG